MFVLALGCGDDEPQDGTTDETSATLDTSGAPTTSMTATTATTATTETTSATTTTTDGTEESTGTSESTDSMDTSSSTGEPDDTVTLQNDDFAPSRGIFWQTWPSPGDCWASTYAIDDGLYPFEIVGVEVAIGGAPDTVTLEVGIWEVDGDGLPSTAIDSTMVDIEGDVQGPDIDIEGLLDVPPIDSGSFAVVMCHVDHMGSPSIGTDVDGTVDGAHNFVFQENMGEWVSSPDFFGTDGDWVLRTKVRPN